jgi:hypothetical protein
MTQRVSPKRQASSTTEQQTSQERVCAEVKTPMTPKQYKAQQETPAKKEPSISPMTPDQERRVSFLYEHEEYASSLERIITQAGGNSVSCSPSPPAQVQLERQPTATTKKSSQKIASFEKQVPVIAEQSQPQEQRVSVETQTLIIPEYQEREASAKAEILITPDQERRISFLYKRDEYISSLEQVIARARENSHPVNQSMVGGIPKPSFVSTSRSMIKPLFANTGESHSANRSTSLHLAN